MVELEIVLLDGRPILPPAQLAIVVPIEVVEAPFEGIFRNRTIPIVSLDHHVVLSHPLLICQDSIVNNGLLHVALTLGIVPEPSDKPIVPIVLVMLPLLDNPIVICVSESELMADVGLIAHVVVDDVVQTVQMGKGKLQVFPSVALFVAYQTFCIITGTTLQEVEHIFVDRFLIKRSQIALQVDGRVLSSVVLKKLFKTELLVIIEVHHLEDSDVFGAICTSKADVSD